MRAVVQRVRSCEVTVAGELVGRIEAGLLVLPLAWVLWSREGAAGLRRWPALAGGSLLVFLATSPYVLLDARAFWHDFRFEATHMAGGHLGSTAGGSAAFAARSLWLGLGPVGALAALAGLATPLWRRRRPDADEVALWLAAVPLLVTMLVAAFVVHADDPWGKKEFALLYAIPALSLIFTGGGRFSLDQVIRNRRG